MSPWWEGPLVGFDTETTGVDVETARIVSVTIGEETWLINPGVPIPDEAAAVHGITTERAEAEGDWPVAVLAEVHQRLWYLAEVQTPVVAFNAAYDFTLLDREFRRHQPDDDRWAIPRHLLIVDPYVLDKHTDPFRRGARKLVDLCRMNGVDLLDAHTSQADADAAVAVARVLGRKVTRAASIHALQWLQAGWRWEQQKSLEEYFRRTDPTAVVDPHWPIAPLPVEGAPS